MCYIAVCRLRVNVHSCTAAVTRRNGDNALDMPLRLYVVVGKILRPERGQGCHVAPHQSTAQRRDCLNLAASPSWVTSRWFEEAGSCLVEQSSICERPSYFLTLCKKREEKEIPLLIVIKLLFYVSSLHKVRVLRSGFFHLNSEVSWCPSCPHFTCEAFTAGSIGN